MVAELRSHMPQGAKSGGCLDSNLPKSETNREESGLEEWVDMGVRVCVCVCVCVRVKERQTDRQWQRETGRHREIWMTLSLEGLVWGYSVLGSNPPKKWTTGKSEIREKAKTVGRCFIQLRTAVTCWLWIPLSPPRSHTEHPGTVQKGAKLT